MGANGTASSETLKSITVWVRAPVEVLVFKTENALVVRVSAEASAPPWSHLQSPAVGSVVKGEFAKAVSAPECWDRW